MLGIDCRTGLFYNFLHTQMSTSKIFQLLPLRQRSRGYYGNKMNPISSSASVMSTMQPRAGVAGFSLSDHDFPDLVRSLAWPLVEALTSACVSQSYCNRLHFGN